MTYRRFRLGFYSVSFPIRLPILAVLILVGGAVRSASAADLSTPIGKAAATFLDAAAAGDRKAMTAAAVPGAEQTKAVDAFIAIDSSARGLREASVRKWGESAAAIWPVSSARSRLAEGKISEQGDRATIAFGASTRVMRLQKVDGAWRVDATSMPLPAKADAVAAVLTSLSAEVNGGAFADMPSARSAMNQRLAPLLAAPAADTAALPADSTTAPLSSAAPNAAAPNAAAPGAAAPPATNADEPKTTGGVVQAADTEALRAASGKKVVVEGKVKSAEWSKSGKVLTVEFEGVAEDGFMVAVFSSSRAAIDAVFDGDATQAWAGRKLRVEGPIKIYKERPEIVVDKPSQVAVVKEE